MNDCSERTRVGDRRAMRIAFMAQPVDSMYPPVLGGSLAIWIYQVARICARRGHHTIAFANHGSFFRSAAVRSEDVDYVYTPTILNLLGNSLFGSASRSLRRSANGRSSLPAFASTWLDLGYAMEVGHRTRSLACDVVHVMNYSQYVPVIRRLNPRCKICLHMHCEWLTQLDYKIIEKRLTHADLVIGCSEYITEKIAKRFPQFAKKCVTVPNASAVTPEENKTDADPGYVLFVGRVSPEKGVHDLLRAFHDVLRQFPSAHLHVVGGIGSAPLEYMVGLSDDPHVADLRVYYERKGDGKKDPYGTFLEEAAGEELGKRIFFEGRIPHNQIDACYRRAAVLVNPSLSESFGMSLVEAMMHRVPVVATRVGGMTHIVDHGLTGLLLDPANPSALAAAICQILADAETSRRMGDAGRKKALDRFSWEKATDVLLDHFSSITC